MEDVRVRGGSSVGYEIDGEEMGDRTIRDVMIGLSQDIGAEEGGEDTFRAHGSGSGGEEI
jgi:hypothetical protein